MHLLAYVEKFSDINRTGGRVGPENKKAPWINRTLF
jgi:hypothetical protein